MSEAGTGEPLLAAQLRERLTDCGGRLVHIILVATKPDIIKQYPLYAELAGRGEIVLVCHTGQHYDHRYSGAMLEEFGLPVDIHLGIAGTLSAKTAQMIDKFGRVLAELRELGLTPIPYIHGDTATSMAIGVASYVSQVACAHVEAGIRTITPTADFFTGHLAAFREGRFDFGAYAAAHRDPASYSKGSREPFPEQFNTRVSDAGSGYHAAPVELAAQNLIDEGFPPDTIEVTGNTVVDATVAARADAAAATIFETYPQLRGGGFIRVCIHRRENTDDEIRFRVLFDALEALVRGGRPVLFIRLFGTDAAIDRFGLRERLDALSAEFPETFISSEVWPHYRDVIAAMLECALVATDSGSMQEEMNILGVPCVTLRFGSDRGETLLAGSNLLAPPVDAGFVVEVIEGALGMPSLGEQPNLYGDGVTARIVDGVLARAVPGADGQSGPGLFRAEEARLGL
ncbi:MAG: UDP-N-acetylglucosamine 2-epimerase [Nocardioides sp.]